MPRIVRNFWFTANVAGKQAEIASGPKSATGGLSLNLYQRDNGEVKDIFHISCQAHADGYLETIGYAFGKRLISIATMRDAAKFAKAIGKPKEIINSLALKSFHDFILNSSELTIEQMKDLFDKALASKL